MGIPQVAALVIFIAVVCGVIGLVLHPASCKLPRTKVVVPISYSVVPLLGVLLMLICGSLDGAGLARGIVGNADMQPYSIVILFMALAYISSSLDSTGVFAWLALHITRFSRGRGLLLFSLYFALSSIMTVVTSNDIVIMTLTPIVLYFSAATGTDPIPFLTAEFTAANIWSMALFIGNPTNIIVADAYNLTFLGYSKWMVLPTLGKQHKGHFSLQIYQGRRQSAGT
jgi:Na+/H+ antiporter NhaD/arsenite permease-like protein